MRIDEPMNYEEIDGKELKFFRMKYPAVYRLVLQMIQRGDLRVAPSARQRSGIDFIWSV